MLYECHKWRLRKELAEHGSTSPSSQASAQYDGTMLWQHAVAPKKLFVAEITISHLSCWSEQLMSQVGCDCVIAFVIN